MDRALLELLGDTEETLACFEAAEALDANRLVAAPAARWSTGRGRPRCRSSACRGSSSRARPSPTWSWSPPRSPRWPGSRPVHTEIDAAAAFLADQSETLQQQAREIATLVAGAVPVIYGSDLTAPVARRWKTQVNENAKFPAFWGELPEADHNELCGWSGAAGDERAAAIFLEDRDQHPRIARRFELTAKSVKSGAAAVARVETAGETRLERMLWAVMLGDLVSLELARQRGVDPMPVEAIERFKEEMG